MAKDEYLVQNILCKFKTATCYTIINLENTTSVLSWVSVSIEEKSRWKLIGERAHYGGRAGEA